MENISQPVRVIITGASGLLGRAVVKELNACRDGNMKVLGLSHTRPGPSLLQVDLTCPVERLKVLNEVKPNVIVNLAAERNPDQCENNAAGTKMLNVDLPEALATYCTEHKDGGLNPFLLHVSTDYVFDGKCPPYVSNDPTSPLNAYGESKVASEKAVLSADPLSTILRVPVLYGDTDNADESAVTCIATTIAKQEPCKFDDWAVRYPTHVDDVAAVIRDIVMRRCCSSFSNRKSSCSSSEFAGILQWSSEESKTKYDIAQDMINILGVPHMRNIVSPISEPPPGVVLRPQNSHLDSTYLRQHGIGPKQDIRLHEGLATVSAIKNIKRKLLPART